MSFTYTKRKDGRLTKKISINGKAKYLYAKNVKDLKKQYIEIMHNEYNGFNINNEQITLKQWAEKWYNVNISQKEYNTRKNIRLLLDKHIYPNLGYIKLKDLRVIHIRELQKNMLEEGLTSTCNRTITTLKRILNDAVENDIINKNVAFNVKSVKYKKQERKPLSIYEDKLFVDVARTHKYGLFFLLLRFTGMRREEIVPLTINDVNLIDKTISINKATYFQKNQPQKKSTKNNKTRIVPILDIIYQPLKQHIKNCINNNQELLFVKQSSNEMLSISAIRWMDKSFLNAMNECHYQTQKLASPDFVLNDNNKIRFTNHSLRHSYCTMLYYANVGIKEAQALMGHQSADMVYNIYTHLDTERGNTFQKINDYCNKNLNF